MSSGSFSFFRAINSNTLAPIDGFSNFQLSGKLTLDSGVAVTAGDYAFQRNLTGQMVWNVPTAQDMLWSINGVAQLTLDSSGNLGLGMTPVTDRLAVSRTTTATNGLVGVARNVLNVEPVANTSATYYGSTNYVALSNSGAGLNFTGQLTGYLNQVILDATTGTYTSAYGGYDSLNIQKGTLISGIGSYATFFGAGATVVTVTDGAAFVAKVNVPNVNLTATNLRGAWVQAFTAGATITNAIGLQVDPPGTGTNQWTAIIGSGNSRIEGSLTLGSTSVPTATFDIVQPVSTSGTPTGFKFTGGAHTTLAAGVALNDFLVDLERTVQFSTGAINNPLFGSRFKGNVTLGAVGASTIDSAVGFAVTGMPIAGTNVTLNSSVNAFFEAGAGNADALINVFIESPRLRTGKGNNNGVYGLLMSDESIVFSDTTGTTGEYYLVNFGEQSLTSSGATTRTITDAATLRIKAPVAGDASVVFTNPALALHVDSGDSRFDEKVSIGKATATYTLDVTGDVRLEASTNKQFFYTNSSPTEGAQGFRSEISSATGTINYSGFMSAPTSGVAKTAGTTSAFLAGMTVNAGDNGGIYTAFNAGAISATASTTTAVTVGTGWDFSVDATSGIGKFVDGVSTKYSTANIADPNTPTDAELDSAFGDPSTLPSGFFGILDDNGAGTDVFAVITTGVAGEWFFGKFTKAV